MHEEQTNEAQVMTDAERYKIAIERTRVFKGSLPRPGNIFYVAKFNNKKHGYQEPYQVSLASEEQFGEAAAKESVIKQVVDRHFVPAV